MPPAEKGAQRRLLDVPDADELQAAFDAAYGTDTPFGGAPDPQALLAAAKTPEARAATAIAMRGKTGWVYLAPEAFYAPPASYQLAAELTPEEDDRCRMLAMAKTMRERRAPKAKRYPKFARLRAAGYKLQQAAGGRTVGDALGEFARAREIARQAQPELPNTHLPDDESWEIKPTPPDQYPKMGVPTAYKGADIQDVAHCRPALQQMVQYFRDNGGTATIIYPGYPYIFACDRAAGYVPGRGFSGETMQLGAGTYYITKTAFQEWDFPQAGINTQITGMFTVPSRSPDTLEPAIAAIEPRESCAFALPAGVPGHVQTTGFGQSPTRPSGPTLWEGPDGSFGTGEAPDGGVRGAGGGGSTPAPSSGPSTTPSASPGASTSPSPSSSPAEAVDFTVEIDDKPGQDAIADSLVATFKIKLNGSAEDYDGTSSLNITFSKRSDGVTPAFKTDGDALTYSSNENTLTYKIPFDESTILYPGDQFADIVVTNRDGASKSQRISFAVGARTLYAGTPPGSTGYKLLQAGTDTTYVPKAVKEAEREGLRIVRIPASNFSNGFNKPGSRPPSNWQVFVVMKGAELVLHYCDGSYDTVYKFLMRDRDEYTEVPDLGKVTVPLVVNQQETATQFEVNSDSVHELLVALKERKDPQYELWANKRRRVPTDPTTPPDEEPGLPSWLLVGRTGPSIAMPGGALFHMKLVPVEKDHFTVTKVKVPGFWDVADHRLWPNPTIVDFPIRQWTDTVREIYAYTPDYNGTAERCRFEWNLTPKFKHPWRGQLADDGKKPYAITQRPDLLSKKPLMGAAHIAGRIIAGVEPEWAEPEGVDKVEKGYNGHVVKRNHFKGKYKPTVELGKDYYEDFAKLFVKGVYPNKKNPGLLDPLRNIHMRYLKANDKIYLYQDEKNQFLVLGEKTGRIVSFFGPDEEMTYYNNETVGAVIFSGK